MGDDKIEASRASTSKIEEQSNHSKNNLEDDKRDIGSNVSYDSNSSMYSVRSDSDMADMDREISKLPRTNKSTSRGKKKVMRRSGIVQKRRRVRAKPLVNRRTPKRPSRVRKYRRNRDFSMSEIIRGSSKTKQITCQYCGHRCCSRRYKNQQRRFKNRKLRERRIRSLGHRGTKRGAPTKKCMFISGLESIQAGSRSKMLSPLFINTNEELLQKENSGDEHCEVSPQMICEALKKLSMWRQASTTASILNHLKMNYPVNPSSDKLENELREKLRVAAIAGIVTQISDDSWALSGALQKRKPTKNHVTLFWKIYGDTMTPINVRELKPKEDNTKERSTSATYNEDIL